MAAKSGPSATAILLSTAACVSVCLLLVAFADNEPAVLMDWDNLQEAQMMGAYEMARKAGDSELHKADPKFQASSGSSSHRRTSSEEAVKELKHLKKITNDVWPATAKPHTKLAETSTQMLAHYKALSWQAWPSHSAAHPTKAAQSAEQELAHFKKISSLGLTSEPAHKRSLWHETAHQLFQHYQSVSSKSMPSAASRTAKPALSAAQELAHYKKLSAEAWPSEHSAHHALAHQASKKLLTHYKKSPEVSLPIRRAHLARRQHRILSQKLSRTIAGGLEITDLKVGSGAEPSVGEKIKVHYTGKLSSGKVFDSGDISFKFGEGQVIKGWDMGLKGMRAGGERSLVIPPELAYGSRGTPGGPIPPGATLHFDVKLLKA